MRVREVRVRRVRMRRVVEGEGERSAVPPHIILLYPYSENKGDDQLRGYREADLRLCFRICKKTVISRRGS